MTRNDSDDLVVWEAEPATGQVLVHAINGFLDAGGGGRLAVAHLVGALEHEVVARIDIDALFDYRARRPRMTFAADHYDEVDLPAMVLRQMRDDAGRPFLLLSGPEPDIAWQRLVTALVGVVDTAEVPLTIGLHAVPWPAPHTRPVGVTAHATTPSLIEGRRSWVGALEVPGHLGGLLELSLGRTGHDAMGFAAHVPHYLAGAEYPRAALALLEDLSAATGLALPLGALAQAADRTDADVNAQLATNPENSEAVRALEAQYDAFLAERGEPSGGDAPLPSGEEIAEQVEQFLAELDARGREES